MVEQETRPRAAAPRVRRPRKLQVQVVQSVQSVQPAQVVVQMTAEQELEQLKQYARKMRNSSKEEAVAFLQRAGIMDARGNVKKAYRA